MAESHVRATSHPPSNQINQNKSAIWDRVSSIANPLMAIAENLMRSGLRMADPSTLACPQR